VEVSDVELCSRCSKKHIYFLSDTEEDCILEKNLIGEFVGLEVSEKESIIKMEKTLQNIKRSFWKDKNMKGLVDDAIQDNRNYRL
jgi:hypothetical protein